MSICWTLIGVIFIFVSLFVIGWFSPGEYRDDYYS